MKMTVRQRLLTSTLLLGIAGITTPAFAQDDQPTVTSEDEGTGEAIVITGSRIARRDLTSTSPVAVVSNEEFTLSGAVNVEQVINQLPQVIPGATQFSNNPGGGFATLDLRGLGSARTLVLVNGRRWMFFDASQRVDLNTIPQFLIDSVDVVTGGASAVYGSDALAGVVNFRLRTDLDGMIAGGQYSISEEGDGRRYNAYIAMGTQFADGRGHVAAYAEYYNRGQVMQGDRSFTRFALADDCVVSGSTNPRTGVGQGVDADVDACPAGSEPGFIAGGSSVVSQGRVNYFGGANFNAAPAGNWEDGVFNTRGTSTPFAGELYNYAPANYLMVPQERWLLGGYGEYEIAEGVTGFAEVTYVNNRVQNELAATPIGDFFNLNVAQNCAFLSAADCAALTTIDANETVANAADGLPDDPGVVNALILRRIVETGSRNSLDERNAFRVMAGVRGNITETLNYEVYYSFARTRNSNIQAGNISFSAFQNGLDGTSTPIDIFGPGSLTPDMVDQISILAQNTDISQLQVASATVSGSLFNFGWGGDDVAFATGVEWRSVSSQFIPDTALASGDVIGFNAGQATAGGYNVKEVFAELRVPIVADRPFFHRLELSGAARYSDYSLEAVGGVWTYAGGVEWAPISDITFRGQYQRAIRAPNVDELFGGLANGFPAATDPCATAAAAAPGTLRDLCIATGVPAARVGNPQLQLNPQIQGLFGGNPDLQEETGDTWTVGAVIRPSFIPRLNITVDYYNIKIEDAISTFGGGLNNTINLCYNVFQDATNIYCQAIAAGRNAAGNIGEGTSLPLILNANVGAFETSGIDFQVDYNLPINFSALGNGDSRLNFFFLGTWLNDFDITPVSDQPDIVNQCAGRFGTLACGNPIPKWKWTSRLSWIDGPVTTSFRWRHVNSVRDDDPDTVYTTERISSYDLFDLAFAFDISDNVTINAGVNNLFDKRPTFVGTNQEQSNTYPSTYDLLGRDYFVSASFRF